MPKAVEFPQQNVVFGANQPEYNPLPAFKNNTKEGEVVTCWELSEEEIEMIIKTKRIYLMQITFNQPFQPVWMGTECPLNEEVNAPYN